MRSGVRHTKITNSFHNWLHLFFLYLFTYLEDKNPRHHSQGSLVQKLLGMSRWPKKNVKRVLTGTEVLPPFLSCLQCALWGDSDSCSNLSQLLKRNELCLTRMGIHMPWSRQILPPLWRAVCNIVSRDLHHNSCPHSET